MAFSTNVFLDLLLSQDRKLPPVKKRSTGGAFKSEPVSPLHPARARPRAEGAFGSEIQADPDVEAGEQPSACSYRTVDLVLRGAAAAVVAATAVDARVERNEQRGPSAENDDDHNNDDDDNADQLSKPLLP